MKNPFQFEIGQAKGKDYAGLVVEDLALARGSFYNCRFTGANLNRVRGIEDANRCDFAGAIATECEFVGEVWPAKFQQATITGTVFKKDMASYLTKEQDRPDFRGALAERAVFDGLNLHGADFRGASLRGASFWGANLQRADFSGADLTGADFTGARLVWTIFVRAIVHRAIFTDAEIVSPGLSASLAENPRFTIPR